MTIRRTLLLLVCQLCSVCIYGQSTTTNFDFKKSKKELEIKKNNENEDNSQLNPNLNLLNNKIQGYIDPETKVNIIHFSCYDVLYTIKGFNANYESCIPCSFIMSDQ